MFVFVGKLTKWVPREYYWFGSTHDHGPINHITIQVRDMIHTSVESWMWMFISLPRPELHGLDRYLQQMDKILEALNYFKKHNQNTVELRDVVSNLIHTQV